MKQRETREGVGGTVSDRDLIRLVAELYYIRDIRQPEIAALTGFSVSKVSRLLAQARDAGVVHFSIEPPAENRPALAGELADRFGVEVEITPGREADPVTAARVCGLGAAEAVVRALPATGTVGGAGGYTLDSVIAGLPRLERPGLRIVPVVGGWDPRTPHLDTNELVRRLGERLGASVRLLHAPGMLDSESTKDALLADSGVAETTRYWGTLDLAIVGLSGGPLARPGYRTVMDRLDEPGRQRLVALNVVADLAGHLFREDGQFVEDEWSRRTISIALDALRKVPRVMAIAAGSNKVHAVLGALRTGYLHVIVTDRTTAEGVMRLADQQVAGGR